jgi:SAM-dependent methyltransferase
MIHRPIDEPPAPDIYKDILRHSFTESYNTVDDVWTDDPAMRAVVQLLLPRLRDNSHILDIGAGRGRDTLALLRAGHRVDAIDLIRSAEWSFISASWSDRVAFSEGDFLNLSLESKYDAVLDNGCLHHQHPDSYNLYFDRLRRVTHENAQLLLSFFTPAGSAESGGLSVQEDGRLTRDFSVNEAHQLLEAAGWQVAQTERIARLSKAYHYLVVAAVRLER